MQYYHCIFSTLLIFFCLSFIEKNSNKYYYVFILYIDKDFLKNLLYTRTYIWKYIFVQST